jgi:hypothetical protein
MNTEHGAEDIRTFSKGANSDKEKELLGAKDTGEYIKSRNARNYSVDGNTDALEKIKGEVVVFPRAGLSVNFVCIGVAKIKDLVIEFWASPISGDLDTIRIDGTVVASNDGLLFDPTKHLQLDTNDECKGGEVFITDNVEIPMIFNVGDLLSNVGVTQKYFTDFNRKLYEINLETPVDKPVFTKLITVGGGGGLPVGQYSYALRYVNAAGDRTNLSPSTPLIPVVQANGQASPEYPGTKTRGDSANVSVVTSFGIELKFRITNELDYDSIEIIRYAWNAGTQLGFTPDPKIIGRVDVSGIKIGVHTFIDPVNSNIEETIPEDELTNQLLFIERAKAIRYFDKRLVLMNYEIASRSFEPVFTERNGEVMFPIMDAMGKQGHNDAHNHTYKKSYPSGEIFGFAINAYDGVSAKGFAVPIIIDPVTRATSFQFPNRRDELATGSNSDVYSTGAVTAANTAGNVTETFEVFDLEDTKGKDDICSFKGILDGTNALGITEGNKPSSIITKYCTEDPERKGAIQTALGVAAPYSVYHPIGDSDPSVFDHNYRVNVEVNDGSNDLPYNPDMFGLNYFSKGIALNGIAKSSIPDWVKSFTVVRTERANRVVCQGLGMYSMIPADRPNTLTTIYNKLTTKASNKFWFYSPDISEGVVNQSIVEDMKNNPKNYKIEFVSPLGFASETYSFDTDFVYGLDRQIDMMTYARVLKDGVGGKVINPGDAPGFIGNAGYTAYNKYRNSSDLVNGDFFSTADGGNRLAQLTDFFEIVEGRGSYFSMETQEQIYNHSGTGGNNEFEDQGMKDWTEPFYIINIIQEGASIVDQNIDTYKDTGAYIKMESIIAEGSAATNLRIELIDERWEDCIPALAPTDPTAGEERFIYVRDASGNDLPWYNYTYESAAQQTIIVNDILTNGFHVLPSTIQVYGVYNHDVVTDREIFLDLNVPGFNTIPVGSLVLIKYDENAPIKIFGGDTTVGDTVFAPIDKKVNMERYDFWDAVAIEPFRDLFSASDVNRGFSFNVGFPYRQYIMNPRHYIAIDPKSLVDKVQNDSDCKLGYLRQLCVTFTVESRIATHFAYNENYPNEFFPNTHYVMRPNRYDESQFAVSPADGYEDNSIHPQYEIDYGDEYLNWDYGGIRFIQNYNIDYSQQNLTEFVSEPDFGFDDVTEFCTGVVWSLPRAVNQQDSPGLKSFQALNSVQLEDGQGQINMAYDAQTSKGSNIYAILERGVCLLLHKKSILSDTTGAEIGLFTGNNFVQGEYWLDRNIGSNEDMWRGAAEGSIAIKRTSATGKEDGEQERIEGLIFTNDMSVYRLLNNEIKDIGRDAYYSEIRKAVQGVLGDQNSRVTAYYDEDYNEFLIQLEYQDPEVVGPVSLIEDSFVYSFNSSAWVSNFDYRFDKYLSIKEKLYGMREGETYELNEGTKINSLPINFEVEQVTSVAPQKEKEYIKINVNSDNKPTRVEFQDIKNNLLCALDPGIQGPFYLKKYDGYAQQIPRKDLIVSPTRDRVQDRLLIYKIFHNLEEDFVVKNVVITFKAIK